MNMSLHTNTVQLAAHSLGTTVRTISEMSGANYQMIVSKTSTEKDKYAIYEALVGFGYDKPYDELFPPKNYIDEISFEEMDDDDLYYEEEVDALNNVSAEEIIEMLPDKAKDIVNLYYMEDYTLEEVGAHYGYTRERIRQIIVTSFRAIREHFKLHNCEAFFN